MRQQEFTPTDFAYGAPSPAGRDAALSIYADRPNLRATLREDAQAAGLSIARAGVLSDLAKLDGSVPGGVVFVDCPQVDAAVLAALARLDLHAARGEVRLIVSTGVDALDDVFACMDQSAPVFLVNPDRAERVIALGRVLATMPGGRVRELSEDDRLMLLRLSEQVGQIAGRMERLDRVRPADEAVGGGEAALPLAPDNRDGSALAVSRRAVALPEARLVRRIIRQRQLRGRFLDAALFADPAWDMLLDLTAARVEGQRVSVTSLCIASGVPPTTALRWIGQMVEAGLFARHCDDTDRRRAFIGLTDRAVAAMARYFAELALTGPSPV